MFVQKQYKNLSNYRMRKIHSQAWWSVDLPKTAVTSTKYFTNILWSLKMEVTSWAAAVEKLHAVIYCAMCAYNPLIYHLHTRVEFFMLVDRLTGVLSDSMTLFFNSVFLCTVCFRPSNGFVSQIFDGDQELRGFCHVECAYDRKTSTTRPMANTLWSNVLPCGTLIHSVAAPLNPSSLTSTDVLSVTLVYILSALCCPKGLAINSTSIL